MAVGDAASAAGYPLVPDSGSPDALIEHGAREINRTRDLIANFVTSFTYGSSDPAGGLGKEGDIYFKVL